MHSSRRQRWRSIAQLAALAGVALCATLGGQDVGSKTYELSVGTIVPVGEYTAVGTIPGCTATLIDQDTVLTAAHCVCSEEGPDANLSTCVGRTVFTLHDVVPMPDPATPWLIPTSRTDVSIGGTVYVHPEFGQQSWLFYDIAIIKLDRPVEEVARTVKPIPIELNIPNSPGESVTLVGYGRTGLGCSQNSSEKRTFDLTIDDCGPLGILLVDPVKVICSGDSGSPLINPQGRIIGVASHGDVVSGNSTFRPLYSSGPWISQFLRGSWSRIHGPVDDVILGWNTIERRPLIYAIDAASDDLYGYNGVSWTKAGGPGAMFAVAGAGQLFGLTPDHSAVKRYQGSVTGWASVGGAAATIYGAIDHHPNGLYATNPISGDLMAYDGSGWRKIGGPGEDFAFGQNGTIYRIDPGGTGVSRYDGTPNAWTKIGGPAGEIYAAQDVLVATNPTSGDLYRYNGTPYSWSRIGGPARMFAVGDNHHLYGLATDGSAVFQYLATPNRWMRIGEAADAIYAIGDVLLATSPGSHELWQYEKD